jgi:transposase InsO family protein
MSIMVRTTMTKATTNQLSHLFHDFGFPRKINSDRAPQFRGKFDNCCRRAGLVHKLSSAFNPRSNGMGENGVKQLQALMFKCDINKESYSAALAEWRGSLRAGTPQVAGPAGPGGGGLARGRSRAGQRSRSEKKRDSLIIKDIKVGDAVW